MSRKIPMKNYFITFVLSVITIVIVFSLMNVYNKRKDYKESSNKNLDILSEIKENELETYFTENHDGIIYMSSSNNKNIEEFEKELKKYIIDKNLTKEIVYLNMFNVNDTFYNEFYLKYFDENSNINIDLTKEPNIFIVNNGRVVNYLLSDKEQINIEDVKNFFKENGVLE